MMYLDLDRIKKHLNINDDFKDDDSYIESLADVAEAVVENHIDESLETIMQRNGGELPPPLLHSMLLLIGTLYMQRESTSFVSMTEVPLAYKYMLQQYKNYKRSNI